MDKNIPLYLAFIDIAKAYDSVHRPTLWKILQTIGIPPKLLALLKTLYGENNCRVKFCNKFSKSLKLLEGLKQGCPAACILFNIFFPLSFSPSDKNSKQKEYSSNLDLMGTFLIFKD
jgi:hypothetical protein